MTDRGTLSQRNAEIERGYNNMRRLIVFAGSAVALTCVALMLIAWSVPSMADQRKDDGGRNQQGQADKRDDRRDGPDADIMWNPSQLSVSLKPNEATSVPVTLIVREKQDDQLTVFVSTSLKDIVSVTPTTLGQLRKGQTETITIVLKLPILAQPGTTTGFMQLYEQDGKKKPELLGTKLPITVTVVWPTTTSPKGATMSYPGTFSPYGQLNELTDTVTLTNFGGAYARGGLLPAGGADIVIADLPPLTESLNTFLARELSRATIESQDSILIDGKSAIRVIYTESFTPTFGIRYVEVYVPLLKTLHRLSLAYNLGDPRESEFLNAFQVSLDSIKFPK